MSITKLKASQLRRRISNKVFPFETTSDLKPLKGVIGQERAIKALELALEIQSSGYNVFVTGMSGTGRTTIVEDILHNFAQKRPVPCDWCYVYNFTDPDTPEALSLPAGKGKLFKRDMNQLISTLKKEIQRAFSSEHYEEQKRLIIGHANEGKRKLLKKLEENARKLGIQIKGTSTGFQTIVLKDDHPISSEEYDQLSEPEKEEINRRIRLVEEKISETVRALTRLDLEAEKSLTNLNEKVAGFVVEQYINEVKARYARHSQIIHYLDNVSKDIIGNIIEFLTEVEKEGEKPNKGTEKGIHFRRYQINVVVDNSRLQGAPVIYETNTTYNNLFGRIEKHSVMGTYVTDFTLIKAGSLLKANGGYLMADAYQILKNPFVYDALKRAIRNREIRIEDVSELYGFLSTATLKPQPIPLNVKVILIGWSQIYHLLYNYDEDFPKVFKIRADFDYEADASVDTILKYAQFIKRVVEEEKLLPFHRNAVREMIYHSQRQVEDQKKLSLKLGAIVNIIRESSFWAKKDGAKMVMAHHVKKATDEYEYRHSLTEDKIQEMIERDIYKIRTDGQAIGEINGLSIYHMGNYVFGRPNRITAKTYIGNENVIHIERKAHLSGKIHDKGVYVFNGFFNWKFGEYIPLAFSASLTFEQSYSLIDGDSASSTELYALISSLSGVPIKQGIAVTGSVNQNGEIQAIGGVNQKIEGYFRVCKAKGLTGEQGVIIPRSNLDNLMLKGEVVDAVRKGKFNIWAVDTVEDGLEILTGRKAGERNRRGKFPKDSIYYQVEEALRTLSRRAEVYRKCISRDKSKKTRSRKKKPSENT